MIREILILDVTAMSGDHVCVAGIDLATKRTIRLNNPPPTREQLKALGYLTPGEVIVVDVVDVEPALHLAPPHVEDHTWNPRSVEKRGRMDNDEICRVIRETAHDSLEAAFGEPLPRRPGRNVGWKPGTGERSLATLRVRYVRFEQDGRETIRVALRSQDQVFWGTIPFQDLVVRAHKLNNDGCCASNLADNVRTEFEANWCLIRVGLTRPFSPDDHEDSSACWLQVTNVFARDRTHFV